MSQNTPESRAAWEKYGDILTLERPAPPARHPRMPAASRAKLFSPFAALRGFDDELSAESAQHRLRVDVQQRLQRFAAVFLAHGHRNAFGLQRLAAGGRDLRPRIGHHELDLFHRHILQT